MYPQLLTDRAARAGDVFPAIGADAQVPTHLLSSPRCPVAESAEPVMISTSRRQQFWRRAGPRCVGQSHNLLLPGWQPDLHWPQLLRARSRRSADWRELLFSDGLVAAGEQISVPGNDAHPQNRFRIAAQDSGARV
jgi:hypothetical protein